MKFTVTVEGHTYTVDIENLDARPVVVWVEGERFEVWPAAQPAPAVPTPSPSPPGGEGKGGAERERLPPSPIGWGKGRGWGTITPSAPDSANHALRAPIPGAIDAVHVKPGDEVKAGQPVCVLEAMKMKNIIRAPRAGRIAEVRVRSGQQVSHNDVLMTYAE